jgi:hypothetical protein
MHIAELFRIAKEPKCDIFQSLTVQQYKASRSLIIELILATDLSRHFEILSGLKAKIAFTQATPKELEEQDKSVWFANDSLLLLKIMLKIADIGHFYKVECG